MTIRFGTLLLAWLIAMAIWSMAHGTSEIERGVDIPISFEGVPDDVVLVGQSVRAVNIRVLGSRAALRDVGPSRVDYTVDVSGVQPGETVVEVDAGRIEEQLPTGARIVSRSPASLELRFARRGRKSLPVRVDVSGEPATGFEIGVIEVEPAQVWLTGERREVLRMREAVTETIDVRGLSASVEREARLTLADHVWMEEQKEVTVRVEIVAIPPPPQLAPEGAEATPDA